MLPPTTACSSSKEELVAEADRPFHRSVLCTSCLHGFYLLDPLSLLSVSLPGNLWAVLIFTSPSSPRSFLSVNLTTLASTNFPCVSQVHLRKLNVCSNFWCWQCYSWLFSHLKTEFCTCFFKYSKDFMISSPSVLCLHRKKCYADGRTGLQCSPCPVMPEPEQRPVVSLGILVASSSLSEEHSAKMGGSQFLRPPCSCASSVPTWHNVLLLSGRWMKAGRKRKFWSLLVTAPLLPVPLQLSRACHHWRVLGHLPNVTHHHLPQTRSLEEIGEYKPCWD